MIAATVIKNENFSDSITKTLLILFRSDQIIAINEETKAIGTPTLGSQTVSIITKNINIGFQYTAKNRNAMTADNAKRPPKTKPMRKIPFYL